jgi:hypothetical protein
MNELQDFVSLGPNCCIRTRIDDRMRSCGLDPGPTNFFDYSLCGEEALVLFLGACDIQSYFNESNISYHKTNDTHGHAHLSLNNMYFKSIHDAKNRNSKEDVKNEIKIYIERYKRRYSRLIYQIQQKNNLMLIRMGSISEKNLEKIRINIESLTNRYRPIVFLDDFGPQSPDIKEKDLFFWVNYNKFYKCDSEFVKKTNWMWMNFLDWDEIFRMLLEVYDKTKCCTNKVFL